MFTFPCQVVQRDAEIVAEDEQVFLMKQQSQLAKQTAPGTPPTAAAVSSSSYIVFTLDKVIFFSTEILNNFISYSIDIFFFYIKRNLLLLDNKGLKFIKHQREHQYLLTQEHQQELK